MIEQQGRAVSAEGDRVRVRLGGQSGCAACDAGRGCGAGVFARMLRRRPVELDFENRVGARSGQGVVVGIPERLYLGLVTRFYLLPVLAALAGAAIGHYLGVSLDVGPGPVDALALGAGLLAGFIVLRRTRGRPAEFSRESGVHLLRVVLPPELETEKR